MSINSGDRPWPQALGHEDMDWPPEDQRVLVPFREAVNLHEAGTLGASITFGTDGELYLLHAVDPDAAADPSAIREDAELKMEIRDRFDVPVVQNAQTYSRDLLETFVETHSITTTVLDREEESLAGNGRGAPSVGADCHTVLGTGLDGFESPSSVLVPVASGPHSGLATRIGEAVARSYGCRVELLHVVSGDASAADERAADRLLDAYRYRLDDDVDTGIAVARASDAAEAIVERSGDHDLTVLGAPEKGKLRRFLFGSTTDEVTRAADARPALTAHRAGVESLLSRWV